MSSGVNTPLMQQYFKIKEQYSDALLLFQVGDFYELFFDDAKKAASFLAIALTKRGKNNGKDIPLCGIPVHALNHYLVKLIKGGFKVAICDQLTKPQPGTVVERGVTKVFTPGTLTDSLMLDEKSASYIFSFFPQEQSWGLIFSELLTAQLFATIVPVGAYKILESELARFFPDEIVLPDLKKTKNFNSYFGQLGYVVSFSDYTEDNNFANLWIEKQFDQKILSELSAFPVVSNSLQNLYYYLKKNQQNALEQFKTIQFYKPEDYLILDSATQKNLEIIKNNQDGGIKNSLFYVIDKAKTAMGSRTIKKWLLRPLLQENKILQRIEVVKFFCDNISILQKLEDFLSSISDLERIVGRIALKRATIQDYLSLKDSLKILPEIKIVLQNNNSILLLNLILEKLTDFYLLVELLENSLNCDSDFDWIIKDGFDYQLDRLRDLVKNGRNEILKLEQKEISRTGINSLKIRYNNISGYYIEVTNPNLNLIPADYIEQQKLVNRKRFVTQELKNLEQELLKAENEIDNVEKEVFDKVKREVENKLTALRQMAQSLAYLDALVGFALVAYNNNYISPIFNNFGEIVIKNGRHPVVEFKNSFKFEANDTVLTNEQTLWIITGPNMGGKSTYLRQVALICIMAQCGSFVPAQSANLSILDRVFTRIGAADNLAEGKSTFLVEMEETAVICNQATKNSLVILDEVGRGTSTNDGIAIAQAIIEYLFENVKARCLFATHYHELTHLEQKYSGIKNYYMESRHVEDKLLFFHKIALGVAKGSFGLEVAKIAMLPEKIIERAKNILKEIDSQTDLQNNFINQDITITTGLNKNNSVLEDQNINLKNKIINLEQQLFKLNNKLNFFYNIDINNLSPLKAFDLICALKDKIELE